MSRTCFRSNPWRLCKHRCLAPSFHHIVFTDHWLLRAYDWWPFASSRHIYRDHHTLILLSFLVTWRHPDFFNNLIEVYLWHMNFILRHNIYVKVLSWELRSLLSFVKQIPLVNLRLFHILSLLQIINHYLLLVLQIFCGFRIWIAVSTFRLIWYLLIILECKSLIRVKLLVVYFDFFKLLFVLHHMLRI
jgi:hypothetical protein